MKSILITAATKMEINPILDHFQAVEERLDLLSARTERASLHFLCTGIGAAAMGIRTAFHLASNNIELAINAGIAGSYRANRNLGDVVNVVSETFGDIGIEERDASFKDVFDINLSDRNAHPFIDGQLINPESHDVTLLPKVHSVTTGMAHGSKESISRIREKYNPDIENMEGAGFFYSCLLANIPFLEIRSISNQVEPRERANWDTDTAILNLSNFLIEMIRDL
ncbi:MAG: futalosine hydrolase [Saprospiraceae bacterium]|nr:futalosine hydrolase [Saprospiraceae bacterium]